MGALMERERVYFISIHAPPRGGATLAVYLGTDFPSHFNPRPPRGGRRCGCRRSSVPLYFNPRPPRGGRRPEARPSIRTMHISIHAPREGGDFAVTVDCFHSVKISIHAPREGGDSITEAGIKSLWEFQSTPPARGATLLPMTYLH